MTEHAAEDAGSSGSRVLGDSALQSTTLEDISAAVNYQAWLSSLAAPYLGSHPIELGSGLGDYAALWLAAGVPRITVTDAEPTRLDALRSRFADQPRAEVLALDALDPPERSHSAYVAFNVLEHIPDHVGALRAAHRLLEPGGAVVMFVPAFPFATSDFDRKLGHVRRYTTRTLGAAFRDAGLRVERLHYVNAPGLLAWFVGMRLLGMTPSQGPVLRVWDNAVIPVVRRLERRRHPPFGQSVFAVGRVPGA